MRFCIPCFPSNKQRAFPTTSSLRRLSTTNPDDVESAEMYSAVDGCGRNMSFMSFASIEVDQFGSHSEAELNRIIDVGQRKLSLLRNAVLVRSGFLPSGTVEATRLWYLPKSSSGPMISLGEVDISGFFDSAFVLRVISDFSRRVEWDPEFLEGEQIQLTEITDRVMVRTCWAACKPRPSAAGRDFVYYVFTDIDEHRSTLVSWSVPAQDVPSGYAPKVRNPANVRGNLLLGGFNVERTETGLRLSYINQVEIGVSPWLSEPVLRKAPRLLNSLKAAILSRYISA